MTSRRNFLNFLGSLSVGAYGLGNFQSVLGNASSAGVEFPDPIVGSLSGNNEMDEALKLLAPYGASFRGGLSNHGPMAAEAMVALGHKDDVIEWVDSYRRRLEERPKNFQKIEVSKWKEALGDKRRSRDWDTLFTKELAESPWQEVVGRWVPRLAPGIAAAGLHGVIRLGHAVCSLTINKNAARLDELARALGYWASEFLLLPGTYSKAGKLAPSLALEKITQLPREKRASRGLITTELKDLIGFEPFVGVIDLVNPSAGSSKFMKDLLATFAGIFINTKSSSFEFLHAVTGSAAVVELLPHVKKKDQAAVLAYTWQVTAGVFARYGQKDLIADVKSGTTKESAKKLAQLAVATGDEHTIKLVTACHREWLRHPDPRLNAASARRLGLNR